MSLQLHLGIGAGKVVRKVIGAEVGVAIFGSYDHPIVGGVLNARTDVPARARLFALERHGCVDVIYPTEFVVGE